MTLRDHSKYHLSKLVLFLVSVVATNSGSRNQKQETQKLRNFNRS
jgi:hypothetical protein